MSKERQSLAASTGIFVGLVLVGALVFGGDLVRLIDGVGSSLKALGTVKVRNR